MDHSHHMGHNHQADHSGHMDHSSHTGGQHEPSSDMGMDMGGGGHGMHMDMMPMSFYFGVNSTVLFDFWKISSVEGLIGSMIGIFIVAALYEGLKYYREYLFWKCYNSLQYRSVQIPPEKEASSTSRVVHVVGEVIHKQPPSMLSGTHALQTLLHIIQITLSYLLMLIFMTYNVWLCIAVVLGAAAGYFLFGWKKSVVVDVTEHCH